MKDQSDNKREWKRLERIRFFNTLGLEPIDFLDPISPLVCFVGCHKETTRRNTPLLYRHDVDCPGFEIVVEYMKANRNGK